MTDDEERQALWAFAGNLRNSSDDVDAGRFAGATDVLFEQAMAQTRMAVCLADPRQPDAPIVFANRAFMALTGYDEDEIIGRNCRFLQGEETDRAAVQKIRDALKDESVVVVELLNYRKDGTKFWNALHLGPIYDGAGKLLYYFGSQWDVSDVHAARAEEAHAKAMSREVSHRMKNMFSVITAIVSLTGRETGDTAMAKMINGRIRALGRANETSLDQAHLSVTDLGRTIRSVLTPYDPEKTRIRYDGPEISISDSMASMIGLIMHELATNAIKYGALSATEGTIEIAWAINYAPEEGADALEVTWQENGGPQLIQSSHDTGTSAGIIETLLRMVDGQIDYTWDPQGLQVCLSMPHRGQDRQ